MEEKVRKRLQKAICLKFLSTY